MTGNSYPYQSYNNKPIVNPGALAHGDFAILKLIRHEKEWKLTETSFHKLWLVL